MNNIEYDPEELSVLARKVQSKAHATLMTYGTLGVAIGFFCGHYFFGHAFLENSSTFVLGLLGFSVGHTKALSLKLQAQSALCQKQIEENTKKR